MGAPTSVQLSVCKESLFHSLKATHFNSQLLPQDTLNYPINHGKTENAKVLELPKHKLSTMSARKAGRVRPRWKKEEEREGAKRRKR
jgi:hypothetical protein